MVNRLIRFVWRRRHYEVVQIAAIFLLATLSMAVVVLPISASR